MEFRRDCLRNFLPRKNAKNAKAILYVFAISAFFAVIIFWLRLQPRGVHPWF